MASREFDVVVFGATGFTGKLVCEYLRDTGAKLGDLKWAIAGRSHAKLESVSRELGIDVPMVVADSTDGPSLEAMAARTAVVLTTVGPYLRYGEALVQACISKKTNYCDLTGELPFIAEMVEKYHDAAMTAGVKIVHSCGFDSIPSDIGTGFLQERLTAAGRSPAVKVKYYLMGAQGSFSRGTAESLMDVVALAKDDKAVRKTVANANALTDLRPLYGKDQKKLVFDEYHQFWTAPFVMESINTRIVRRSNFLQGYPWGKDFDYTETTKVGKGAQAFLKGQAMRLGVGVFIASALTEPTRKLASKLLPKEGGGPDRDKIESGFFNVAILGFAKREDDTPIAKVLFKGPKDPGYGSTAIMLSESAIALSQNKGP